MFPNWYLKQSIQSLNDVFQAITLFFKKWNPDLNPRQTKESIYRNFPFLYKKLMNIKLWLHWDNRVI